METRPAAGSAHVSYGDYPGPAWESTAGLGPPDGGGERQVLDPLTIPPRPVTGSWLRFSRREVEKALRMGEITRPRYTAHLEAFIKGPLTAMNRAIEDRDWVAFEHGYNSGVTRPNAYHRDLGPMRKIVWQAAGRASQASQGSLPGRSGFEGGSSPTSPTIYEKRWNGARVSRPNLRNSP